MSENDAIIQEIKRINKWWQTLNYEEKREIYYYDRGK